MEGLSTHELLREGAPGVKKAHIHIGGWHASKCPTVIHTLLGSCVAGCLFDQVSRIGGMNHILLPGKADLERFDDVARYGINAMALLINRIVTMGGDRRRLTAKVFGGAHIVRAIREDCAPGFKNGKFLLEFLELERIPVLSHDLGGYNARRVYFRTDTGEVLLKRVPTFRSEKFTTAENKYRRQVLREIQKPGQITLFE